MTTTAHDPIPRLRDALEVLFQRHVEQLTQLTIQLRQAGPHRDVQALTSRIAVTREAITDSAHALRRMAEDTYGRCERCAARISLHRLRAVPATRYCAGCGRKADTARATADAGRPRTARAGSPSPTAECAR